MDAGNLELGIIFLIQTGVGILGNLSLLCFYNFSLIFGHKLRSTDLILNQVALANSLVLFSKGIPQTVVAFAWKYFLDDLGCKLVFYCYRVGTGVSLSTICLLNGFRVIKLNPSLCRWLEVKIRSLKFMSLCCLLCWVPHLSINSFLPLIVSSPLSQKNLSSQSHYGFCSWNIPERYNLLYTYLYFSPDLMTLGFMVWASISMVLLLCKHKQRVQHIHSQKHSGSRQSQEARAICTILILICFFLTFYSTYVILTLWSTTSNSGQWMVNSSVFLSSCFPAFSPIVILISDTSISLFCFAHCKRIICFSN